MIVSRVRRLLPMISVTSKRPPPILLTSLWLIDVAKRLGKALTQLLFFLAREHAQDAVDRLAGVNRVQRAEDDVTGLGSGHRNFERLGVANLADQNGFGRLAQGRAQTTRRNLRNPCSARAG